MPSRCTSSSSSLTSSSSTSSSSTSTSLHLNWEQAEKLKQVLGRPIPIHPSNSSSFPTLELVPRNFLRALLSRLSANQVGLSGVRLNGGAASYVLTTDCDFVYRDLDILFFVTSPLAQHRKTSLLGAGSKELRDADQWTIIKYVVASCLLDHLHRHSTTTTTASAPNYSHHYVSSLLDNYAQKNVHIQSENGDSWALLSLQNVLGHNIELKFVERIKRQWQFSVDSFQIDIKSLIAPPPPPPSSVPSPVVVPAPKNSSLTNTKTIRTKNLTIGAINGVNIVKEGSAQPLVVPGETSLSPIQFGFFSPPSSPQAVMNSQENDSVFETLATMTTVTTTGNSRCRYGKRQQPSSSTSKCDASTSTADTFQFFSEECSSEDHDEDEESDEGVETDAEVDDEAEEECESVYCKPLDSCGEQLIQVFSAYNDFPAAIKHLNSKQIATYEPEVVRGGGLLKYCNLLARGYTRHDETAMVNMERYMTSRFFIDYKHANEQISAIAQYVQTHFLPSSSTSSRHMQHSSSHTNFATSTHQRRSSNGNLRSRVDAQDVVNSRLCFRFLEHLSNTIRESTVCLTKDDKNTTLMHIGALRQDYLSEYAHLAKFITPSEQPQHMVRQQQQERFTRHAYPSWGGYHSGSNSSCNSSRSSSPSRSSSTTSISTQNSFRYQQQQYQPHQYRHYPQSATRQFHPHANNNNNNFRNYSNYYNRIFS